MPRNVYEFIAALSELAPNVRMTDRHDSTDFVMPERFPGRPHSKLNTILQFAERGLEWREQFRTEIRRNNLNEDSVAKYIEENWSRIKSSRQRKKLVRELSMKFLLHKEQNDDDKIRMKNLEVSPEDIAGYAKRFASTDYGVDRIAEQIVVAAVNLSVSGWSDDFAQTMQDHNIDEGVLKQRIDDLLEEAALKSESAEWLREKAQIQRTIFKYLDIVEHPEFSSYQLLLARRDAVKPQNKQAVVDALVSRICQGESIHPNYFESMRAHKVTQEQIILLARKKAIDKMIGHVNLETMNFSFGVRSWNNALRKLDPSLLLKYCVDEDELRERLFATLRTLVLREICLLRPKSDDWIGWYQELIAIAGLSIDQVREHLEVTGDLTDSDLKRLFSDLPANLLNAVQSRKPKGTVPSPILLAQKFGYRFNQLWRDRFSGLGEVWFDLKIDGPHGNQFEVLNIREADLLDESPTYETERVLINALTELIAIMEAEGFRLSGGGGADSRWSGVPVLLSDD